MTRQYNPFADDLQSYINEAIKKAIKELQTCIPAIVKKVNSRGEVVVSPAIQRTSPDWVSLPWASMTLPVYTPAGGNGVISVPVSVGDTGWIIAGDLDPSLYFKDPSKPSRQNMFDRHSYKYGFFMPSAMNNFTVDSGDNGGFVIKVGDAKIVVKDNDRRREVQGSHACGRGIGSTKRFGYWYNRWGFAMIGFITDENNDFVLDKWGDITMGDGLEVYRQNLVNDIKMQQFEYRYDPARGINYLGYVLGERGNLVAWEAQMLDLVNSKPFVKRVVDWKVNIVDRVLLFQLVVDTDLGQIEIKG